MSNDTKTMVARGDNREGDSWTGTLQRLMKRLGLQTPRSLPPQMTVADLNFSSKEGRYLNATEIARGGMGAVYSVLDTDLERLTAMKVALPLVVKNAENAAHFVEEAKITARLEHPNIVPVHDLGWDDDIGLFYTMKMLRGVPLDELLTQIQLDEEGDGNGYDLFQLLTIFRKACDAIEFAHSHQVVHLDIKPENIMVGAYGEVQVMDWGIAQEMTAAPEQESADPVKALNQRFKTRREVRGTPAYMAPEQATATIDMIDEQTDVFLLGATLYHILTLTPPYQIDDTDKLLEAAERARITPLNERNPSRQIPDDLAAICTKALAAAKSQRYGSVHELSEAIDQFLAGSVFARRRIFEDGEVLMRAGEHGEEAYLIVDGKADVYRDTQSKRTLLQQLGSGDIVGEMALITSQPRSATVVARGTVHAQVITESHMQNALRKMPPWLGRAVNALADRLRATNARVHPWLVKGGAAQIVKQIALLLHKHSAAPHAAAVTRRLPLSQLEDEVADSLGLPRQRVTAVLDALVNTGLLQASAGESAMVTAPSGEQLDRFATYCECRREDAGDCSWLQDTSPGETKAQDATFEQAYAAIMEATESTVIVSDTREK